MVTTQDKEFYADNGFAVVRGVFSPNECVSYREHFMSLRAEGTKSGDMVADTQKMSDPLKSFPRMIHMHRWDAESLKWILDSRLGECLTAFLGSEPLAVQTMLYFKPAGARGQALHQDNFYLRAQPGTCMAAWMALDDCDEENGCMRVVPGSHEWPVLCTTEADTEVSFTNVTVLLPEGLSTVPVVMKAGDVLFFNGSVVHGSFPNVSNDRFRRALIGHYIESRAERVAEFDQPVLRMDGKAFQIEGVEEGGLCGVWVEKGGKSEIELVGQQSAAVGHE